MPPEPNDAASAQAQTADALARAGTQTSDTEFFNPIPPGYQLGRHKFVVVLGTVMSGLGKGIFSSSLAKLMKDKGLAIAPLKMEGYLNLDSGTLNPYRHGEVFVLDDGLETDMDLGTYERLLDQNLSRGNYLTAGQVYRRVLDREREGGYLGRDVQMIPHVTGEVKYRLRELAVQQQADVVFIEVGGTVGDYENAFYIEALRQLAFEEGPNALCYVALTYVIEPPALGEQKTKAAQLGLKKLLEAGVQPHAVATRGKNPLTDSARQKIAMFSNVPIGNVFSMHDRKSIYSIPEAIRAAGLDNEVLSQLNLHHRVQPVKEDRARDRWRGFVAKVTRKRKHRCTIGLTGKYAALRDAYASIDKALEHAAAHLGAEVDFRWLDTTAFESDAAPHQLEGLDAVIVPGGFGQRGTESKIACIRHCRDAQIPYLGICLGFQMAVVDHARRFCGLPRAGSAEFDPDTPSPVIDLLPEQKKIEGLGGNMRLGGHDVLIQPNTLAAFLYRRDLELHDPEASLPPSGMPFTVRERFRHRFEVDPAAVQTLEDGGLVFSGRHSVQPIMQVLELPQTAHPFFIGGQFHPELVARPLRPHPMFMGLVAAAIRRTNADAAAVEPIGSWLRPPVRDTEPAPATP